MSLTADGPQTFTEMVLMLLEDRFPWLGSDESASGADTVDQLTELHETLRRTRNRNRLRRQKVRKAKATH